MSPGLTTAMDALGVLAWPMRDDADWLARELAYLGRPWGFGLGALDVPVSLWYGERDRVTPAAIGRAYAERLPRATFRLVDDGHQLLFTQWPALLADAVS